MSIDFTEISAIAQSPLAFMLWIFMKAWAIFLLLAIFGFGIPGYLEYMRSRYESRRKFTLLAIDIPKNNEQTPKAVEQIFTQLSAISSSQNWYEKWALGMITETFTFEIVSMGGYIQFLVHTPAQFRDLVEAAVYAQYPDAEIVEVEDYLLKTKGLKFPNDEYDMWGTEFVLAGNQYFPLKSYQEFEHSLSRDYFKDPMSSLMETLSKIGPDEQIWIHLVITPAPDSWKDNAQSLIKKLIGEKVVIKKNIVDRISDIPVQFVSILGGGILGGEAKKEDKEMPNKIQYLTPGEKSALEAVEKKISKIGFYTKLRTIYVARKPSFSKPRGATAIIGAIKQFSIVGQNGLKASNTLTPNVDFPFKKLRNNYRRNKILKLFRKRGADLRPGYYGYVLNTEELASMYHFPVMTVRAPLLKRVESKRAEPPSALPVEGPIDEIQLPGV